MILRLDALEKRFGDVAAVSDLSLEVAPGEFLTLLGPSGCGKTTTLRMIAGFEAPTAGRILLRDRDVTTLPPQRRGVGMVFQNYALFPHLNVFENVAFGLRAQGTARAEIGPRVEKALDLVGLGGLGTRKVQALSGGQQQRVALARALVSEPPVLLLDEPLSNLDAALRERTRTELRALLKRLGMTAIFVTHDQEEAFALSDRIALLAGGRLQQIGTPETLYHVPANAFVASFLGRANFFPARVVGGERNEVLCELPNGARWRAQPAEPVRDGAVRVMVRPESLRLLAAEEPRGPADLDGRVAERRFAGAFTLYRIDVGSSEVVLTGNLNGGAVGDAVRVRPSADATIHAFPENRP